MSRRTFSARRQHLLVGAAQRRGFAVQAVELDAGSTELLVVVSSEATSLAAPARRRAPP